jgi:hypothetical protein
VLLAFSVFMLAVAENLPETSEFVPLISMNRTLVIFIVVYIIMQYICLMFHLFNRHILNFEPALMEEEDHSVPGISHARVITSVSRYTYSFKWFYSRQVNFAS